MLARTQSTAVLTTESPSGQTETRSGVQLVNKSFDRYRP